MSAFQIVRDIDVDAPAERLHPLIADLHEWVRWSPWEGPDRSLTLTFRKPFKAVNEVEFRLEPSGDSTRVSWVMSGDRGPVSGLLSRVLPMDEMVGKDFDRGLARLKSVAESGPA